MKDKYIRLLEDQIEKLNEKDFNPDAWKKHTNIILEHIFGEDNKKIKSIDSIRFDQGSWTLRDTSGTSAIETYRNMGREILEATIFEIKNFGVPNATKSNKFNDIIIESIQDELTGSQFRELKELMLKDIPVDEKKDLMQKKIKSYDTSVSGKILTSILSKIKLHFED